MDSRRSQMETSRKKRESLFCCNSLFLSFSFSFSFFYFIIIICFFFSFLCCSSIQSSPLCSATRTTPAEPTREQPLRCFSSQSPADTASEAEPREASAPANRRRSDVPSRLLWKGEFSPSEKRKKERDEKEKKKKKEKNLGKYFVQSIDIGTSVEKKLHHLYV